MGIYETRSAYQPKPTVIKRRRRPARLKPRPVFNEDTGKIEMTAVSKSHAAAAAAFKSKKKKKKKPFLNRDEYMETEKENRRGLRTSRHKQNRF